MQGTMKGTMRDVGKSPAMALECSPSLSLKRAH